MVKISIHPIAIDLEEDIYPYYPWVKSQIDYYRKTGNGMNHLQASINVTIDHDDAFNTGNKSIIGKEAYIALQSLIKKYT